MTKGKPPSDGEVMEALFSQKVVVDGVTMSMREGMIRVLYNKSLAGDIDASLDLQRLRDECGIRNDVKPAGCLVVREPLSEEEFERFAAKQQAPFREKSPHWPEL